MRILSGTVIASVALPWIFAQTASAVSLRFDFGSGITADGCIRVLDSDFYSDAAGFGFEPGTAGVSVSRGSNDALGGDFVTADKPFLFSVRLPEGSYRISLLLGDTAGNSVTTVKAELRRLMLENVPTGHGQLQTAAFAVNVRTPKITDGRNVRLKPREKQNEMIAWDDRLTLEFNGPRPCVCAVEIDSIDVPTVYLIGDSTVCDQPHEPWNSWGQMLPRFFKPDVVIANHAESGESIRSSLSAGRFDKIWSTIKSGDYLFIQFGHNDMKDKRPDALETYTSNLEKIVRQAQRRGVTCVLVTSMERKTGVASDTLGEYPGRVRLVAARTGAALIDLHRSSKVLYAALGLDLDKAFQDGTHHNAYGSFQLAKCIVQGIKESRLELSNHIVDDFPGFNPAKPDPITSFAVPASPLHSAETPSGN